MKLTLPTPIKIPALLLHSVALAVWLAMLVAVLVYLFKGLSSSFVLTGILILWLLVWSFFSRYLWSHWQYHAASREIIFADQEQIMIRRPLSILGLTWAYDIKHVSDFYYSDQHRCPAFDYAYSHVYFGRALDEEQARYVVEELNQHCFPELSLENSDSSRTD